MSDSKNIKFNVSTNYGQSGQKTDALTRQIKALTAEIEKLKNKADVELKVRGSNSTFQQLQANIDTAVAKLRTLQDEYSRTAIAKSRAFGKAVGTDDIKNVTNALKEQKRVLEDIGRQTVQVNEKISSSAEKARRASEKTITPTSTRSSSISFDSSYDSVKSIKEMQSALRKELGQVVLEAGNNMKDPKVLETISRLKPKMDELRSASERVNLAFSKQLTVSGMLDNAYEKLTSRLTYLITRGIAFAGLDLFGALISQTASIEQGMANFSQVANHTFASTDSVLEKYKSGGLNSIAQTFQQGTAEVNVFGKALDDITTEDLFSKIGLPHEQSEQFKKDIEDMRKSLSDLAVTYGTTIEEMQESATLWGRAYKQQDEVLALTNSATKLAVADNFDIVSANKALESSIMQWGFTIRNATDAQVVSNRVVDSWTAIAHNYTVSAQTMAEANKRMAQSAKEVGVSFDSAQAMVAVMSRYTQAEGGEIGNALKSIFGSIHSNKAISELQKFGVEVYKIGEDGQKQFRKIDDVLLDIMIKAQGSTKNLENLLKAISGGKWQWNKADAMLHVDEYLKVLRMSQQSRGFTDLQVGEQLDTINRKLQSFKSELQSVLQGHGNIAGTIKFVLSTLTELIKFLDRIPTPVFMLISGFTFLAITTKKLTGTTLNFSQALARAFGIGINNSRGFLASLFQVRAGLISAGNGASVAGAGMTALAKGEQMAAGAGRALMAALGGWIGIAMVATTVLADYIMNQRGALGEMEDSLEATQKHIEMEQEQVARMQEATPMIATYSNAIVELTEKRKELTNGTKEAQEVDDALTEAKQGLIGIIGKEGAQELETAGYTEDAVNRAIQAHNTKMEAIKANLEVERQEMIKTANMMADTSKAIVDDILGQIQSWGALSWSLIKHGKIVAGLTTMYWGLSKAIHAGNIEGMKKRLAEDTSLRDDQKEWLRNHIAQEQGEVDAEQKKIEMTANEAVMEEMDTYVKSVQKISDGFKKINGTSSDDILTTTNPHVDVDDSGGGSSRGGSGRGSSSSSDSYAPSNNGEAFMQGAYSMGGSWTLVKALTGNAMAESGGNTMDLDPYANNGSHYGIIQWDDNRWGNYVRWANQYGLDVYNANSQGQYAMYELKNNYSSVYERAMAMGDDLDAIVSLLNSSYEVSGAPDAPRIANARSIGDNSKLQNSVGGRDNEAVAKYEADLRQGAVGVYEYANSEIGLPYLLGGDGVTATDCGKLFADGFLNTFGVEVNRKVPYIMEEAVQAGAWHSAGDGYVPQAGDGVVVLGDNHIVISDGNGGYTGANSSTGVIHKSSVTDDFGAITGYVDVAQLAKYRGATQGVHGKFGSRNVKPKDPSDIVREQLEKDLKQIQAHVEAVQSVYEKQEKDLKRSVELNGEDTSYQAKMLNTLTSKYDAMKDVYKEFGEKAKNVAKSLIGKDQEVAKDMLGGITVDKYLLMNSKQQTEALNKANKEGNKVIYAKLNAIQQLNANYEKEIENLENLQVEEQKQQRALSESIYTDRANELKWQQRDEDFDVKIGGRGENSYTKADRDQRYALANLRLEKEKLKTMQEEGYAREKIQEQIGKIQELTAKAREEELKQRDEIRQGWFDVTNDLIENGSNIKDIWKKLWKDLATEALKMMFRIEDGNHSLLGAMMHRFDKHKEQQEREDENPVDITPMIDWSTRTLKSKTYAGSYQDYVNFQNRQLHKDVFNGGKEPNYSGSMEGMFAILPQLQASQEQVANNTDNTAIAMDNATESVQTFSDTLSKATADFNKGMDMPTNGDSKFADTKTRRVNYAGLGGVLGGLFGGKKGFEWTNLLGMVHFADGGFSDQEQIAHISEGNKREAIVNVSKNDARAKSVWTQAGLEMGMIKTGVVPNFKDKTLATRGVMSSTQQMQTAMMAQQQSQNARMNNALNAIANNTESSVNTINQPIMMKQTMTDSELLTQIMRLKRNGKLK